MTYRQFCYIVLLLWSIRTLSQAIKKLDVSEVDRCPTDLTSWEKASRDLNCTPADRYQCTSNQHRTALVEFCYDQPTTFVLGGHCWILLDSNFVDIYNCSGFTDGCPNTTYRSDELYKYQKCLQLDKLKGCFIADKACLKQREVFKYISTNTYEVHRSTTTTREVTTATPSVTDYSTNEIIIPLVTIGIVIIILVAILFIVKKRGLLTACNCNTRDIEEVHIHSLLRPIAEETVKIEARDSQKMTLTETLTDLSISILNDLTDIINKETPASEIDKLYELIEEIIRENKDERSILESSPFFKELELKIRKYASLQEKPMQILVRFARFIMRLKKNYDAQLESSRGSLLLKLTFSSERGYYLYMKDSETGEIGKLILDVLLYPAYLANFDLRAEDLIIHQNDNELTAERNPPFSHMDKSPVTQISSITIPGVKGVVTISVVTSDRLWVSDSDGGLIQVDSTGHVLNDKLRDKVRKWKKGNHTVTEDGDLLFIDDDEVRKLTSDGTITTVLTTDSIAVCIHSSRINGDILVGNNTKMTRYDKTGRELQVIEEDDRGQSLYKLPFYITENENGDVWISDGAKHAVVVVDNLGFYRFDYTGHQSDDTGPQSRFLPHGICTDVRGHVLVCDWLNGSVHLLDQDGQFLSLLLTTEQHGIHRPTALCLDEHHNLYLGQDDSNTINVYAYLQDREVK